MYTNEATAILNAVPISFATTIDGVHWIQSDVNASELNYDKFKTFPSVIKYREKTYRKTGFNSDSGTIYYKESDQFAIAI